jgi:hypothetical protein
VIKKKYSDYKNLNHPLSTLLPDYIIKLESFKRHYGYSKLNVCSPKLRYIDLLSSGRVCGWEMLLYNIKKKDLFFGRGFFADQVYLEPSEKLSSNSWINILYNTGIVSFVLCIVFFILSLKFLKLKNFNHKNYFISISHYLFLYFIFRSMLEDTLAFASVDFLLSWICFIIIKDNYEKNSLDG